MLTIIDCLVEVLQFKNEHDANNGPTQEEEEQQHVVALGKSEPIMVDRNQYSTGTESMDGFQFGSENNGNNQETKDQGFELR